MQCVRVLPDIGGNDGVPGTGHTATLTFGKFGGGLFTPLSLEWQKKKFNIQIGENEKKYIYKYA